MASLVLAGDTSGSITVAAPAVAGSNTQTLAAVTGTLAPIVSGTAQTAPFTDNTRAEFTGIPPWVRRITVMLSNISTNGTSFHQIQIGSGSFATSGYTSQFWGGTGTSNVITTGFGIFSIATSTNTFAGSIILTNISGNTWVSNGNCAYTNVNSVGWSSSGSSGTAISGTLDRIRVLTVNGTDTFDTGSVINILYE
jgi:hypothetical protein